MKGGDVADILLYWRDYKKNQAGSGGMFRWHSGARMFAGLHAGDRLWLVTSGKNLGNGEAPQAGFLVGVWQVREVAPNPGDDPAYPANRYRHRVVAEKSASILFDEPVLVDHIVRPGGRDRAAPIGKFLQGPRRLSDEKVRLLKAVAGPAMARHYLTGRQA